MKIRIKQTPDADEVEVIICCPNHNEQVKEIVDKLRLIDDEVLLTRYSGRYCDEKICY